MSWSSLPLATNALESSRAYCIWMLDSWVANDSAVNTPSLLSLFCSRLLQLVFLGFQYSMPLRRPHHPQYRRIYNKSSFSSHRFVLYSTLTELSNNYHLSFRCLFQGISRYAVIEHIVYSVLAGLEEVGSGRDKGMSIHIVCAWNF